MITKKVAQAIQIAKDYHSDQVDKSGQPYMEHLYAVANGVKTEEEIIVAFLHDMLEDARTDIKNPRGGSYIYYSGIGIFRVYR